MSVFKDLDILLKNVSEKHTFMMTSMLHSGSWINKSTESTSGKNKVSLCVLNFLERCLGRTSNV